MVIQDDCEHSPRKVGETAAGNSPKRAILYLYLVLLSEAPASHGNVYPFGCVYYLPLTCGSQGNNHQGLATSIARLLSKD